MNRLLLLLFVLFSFGMHSFAQKKPTQKLTPPVIAPDTEEDEGFYILDTPSSHGSFTVTGKEAGKTTKQQVSYVYYGYDTMWADVCDEAHFIFRSAKPVALTVKLEKYRHPEVVYDVPVTVNGNHYHFDLTSLSASLEASQTSYTFAIYDDKKNLVHEISWNLYCVEGEGIQE